MHWLKIHHGFSTDPKLGMIAHQLTIPRAIVNAIVIDLLEHASKQQQRGCITGYDEESAAFSLGVDLVTLRNVTQALCNKRFVTSEAIANWSHYQSAIDRTGAERQARHRQRLKDKVTPVTVSNALRNTEEKRGEEIRVEKKEKKSKGVPLEDLSPQMFAAYYVQHRLACNLELELEKFNQYCLSGKGKYVDHRAAFCGWLLRTKGKEYANTTIIPKSKFDLAVEATERARARREQREQEQAG